MHQLIKQWLILALALCAIGCANRGIGPQGGPKDTIPPVALASNPELGALNFDGKRVEIPFNEYLQLNDLASNLLMSPPQQHRRMSKREENESSSISRIPCVTVLRTPLISEKQSAIIRRRTLSMVSHFISLQAMKSTPWRRMDSSMTRRT